MAMPIKSPRSMPEWIFVKITKSLVSYQALRLVALTFCLSPLFRLVGFGVSDQLTANPIELITRFTGSWALIMLCFTLTITPLRKLSGWNDLLKLRRMFGLFCFFYAAIHLLTWIILDHYFDWNAIYQDLFKRTYITVGLIAFLCLLPLAITSTKSMQKRLGRKWAQLHQLIYLIALLAPLHYWLHKASKNDTTTVNIYIAILLILLLWRIGYYYKLRRQARP